MYEYTIENLCYQLRPVRSLRHDFCLLQLPPHGVEDGTTHLSRYLHIIIIIYNYYIIYYAYYNNILYYILSLY